ncbi:DUF4329 domain-containing protein [Streptomyces nigrescens]|uniref:DUF4329 domain-containing protein n=1 Tax=Streptomyces nigrescens TaxID=1920 RepID=UPI00346C8A8C
MTETENTDAPRGPQDAQEGPGLVSERNTEPDLVDEADMGPGLVSERDTEPDLVDEADMGPGLVSERDTEPDLIPEGADATLARGNTAKPGKGDIPPEKSHVIIGPEGNPVTVLPQMTIYGSIPGSPSDSGKSYFTPDDAARAALSEIDTRSVLDKNEYAGNIYKKSDGLYTFSPPARGTDIASRAEDSPVPPGLKVVATYHSHGGEFLESDELFSPGVDKLKATLGHKDSYLITPRGDMYKYLPVDHLPSAMQNEFAGGLVVRLN